MFSRHCLYYSFKYLYSGNGKFIFRYAGENDNLIILPKMHMEPFIHFFQYQRLSSASVTTVSRELIEFAILFSLTWSEFLTIGVKPALTLSAKDPF